MRGAGETTTTPTPTVAAPTITTQPVAQGVTEGGSAAFSVSATGTGALSYQWKKGSADLTGKTSSALALNPVALTDAGSYTVVITNTTTGGSASITSNAAILTVNPTATTPIISAQPAGVTVTEGGTANFSVTASGNGALTYQWKKGGSDLLGKTASSLSINPITAGDAGSYTVLITNTLNGTSQALLSNAAVLAVNPAATVPVISAQPVGATVTEGGTANFSVTASGNGTVTYQWQKGGVDLLGKTTSSFSINPVAMADAGSYTVLVTNTLNGTSQTLLSTAAVLVVNPAATMPVISAQPVGATVTEGGTANFSVTASGNGAVTYQWKKGGVDLIGKTSFSINPITASDAGSYTVLVTNTLNGTSQTLLSSAAVLAVNPAATTPVFTAQPIGSTVNEGDPANFSVTATGNGTVTYQWYKGGVAISGKTASTLSFNPVALTDAGTYTVEATNALNGTSASAVSNPAILVVNGASSLAITVQPQDKTVTAPDGATFSVTATGTGLGYAWKKNGTAISGETTSSLTIPSTDLHNVADQYSVTVTSTAGGSVNSQVATLTVVAPKPVYAGDPTVVDTGRAYTVQSSWFTTAPADPLGSFRFGYDTALLNPVFSATCFFPSAAWTLTRPSSYPTDTRIPGSLSESDYSGTGYSRGHMVGFADLRDVYGADAGKSTMYMTNMCPQVQALNGGAWGNLETLISGTFPGSFGRVWSYTGPIFSTQLVTPIGAKSIPIPTAFYKIVVRETAPGNPKVLAFVVPHSTTISSGATAATPIVTADFWKFITTVDRVQTLTGLNFFPTPTSPLPAGFTTTVEVGGWGSNLEQGPGKPNVHMIVPSWDTTFTHVHNTTGAVTTINTTTAKVGDVVPFVAQAIADPDPIATTTWNFGDGTTDTNLVTTHTYTSAGSFTVTFTATDIQSHTSSISRIVTINSLDPTVPVISAQPQGRTVSAGTSVTFNVTATGNGTLTYQWRKDGADLAGKTSNSLTFNATVADAGTYSVVVTNTLNSTSQIATSADAVLVVNPVASNDMNEGFETGSKTAYATATVALGTGSWTITDGLIAKSTSNGGSASDHFNGLQGLRLKNNVAGTASGKVTMGFDWPFGAQSVSISIAQYNTDSAAPGTLGLWYSIDGGGNWIQVPGTVTPASTNIETYTWTVGLNQPIRFELRRTDTISQGRMCLDDIHIVGY
ncbi:MAG: immunoglobulin domain-containing protein [Holophaga sp.]|nr:immunoglobulin domain-containing protein [Holophaga sp.]